MSENVIQGKGPSGSPVAIAVNTSGQLIVEDEGGQAGFVALTSPPAQTNAGSDTTLTWSSQVNHYRVQNNTSANLNIHEDSAASAGSFLLVPGATYQNDKPATTFHLFTAAAQNINGTVAANIIVEGWL